MEHMMIVKIYSAVRSDVVTPDDSIFPPSHLTDECGTRPFFKVGLGAESKPTRVRHFQKRLGPRRYSPKRGASGAGR